MVIMEGMMLIVEVVIAFTKKQGRERGCQLQTERNKGKYSSPLTQEKSY